MGFQLSRDSTDADLFRNYVLQEKKKWERRELLIYRAESKFWKKRMEQCIYQSGPNHMENCAVLYQIVSERQKYKRSGYNPLLEPQLTPGLPFLTSRNEYVEMSLRKRIERELKEQGLELTEENKQKRRRELKQEYREKYWQDIRARDNHDYDFNSKEPRAAKEFDRITFDGTGISVYDLKKEIIQQKKLAKGGLVDFDLLISNAQTGEEYSEETFVIPRNTSVLVKRSPLVSKHSFKYYNKPQNQNPQIPFTSTSAPVTSQKEDMAVLSGVSVSEEDRIKHLVEQSNEVWGKQDDNTFQFRRKPMVPMKNPPPNYVCYRCGEKGHFINYCPTNMKGDSNGPRVKRTTGIPKSFLKAVDMSEVDNTEGLMVSETVGLVVVQPNTFEWERFNQLKQGSTIEDLSSLLASIKIPKELQCPICQSLLKEAVTISCCETNYCDDCIRKSLVEDLNLQFICPTCKLDSSPEQLKANKQLRQKCDAFLKEIAAGKIQKLEQAKEAKEKTEKPLKKEQSKKLEVESPSLSRRESVNAIAEPVVDISFAPFEADLYDSSISYYRAKRKRV